METEVNYNGLVYKSYRPGKLKRHIMATVNADNVFDFTGLKNKHLDETAHIFAAGPSLNAFKPEEFKCKLSIALNSAGFWCKPTYWSIIEAAYAVYLEKTYRDYRMGKITLVSSIRAAYYIHKKDPIFSKMYITRFRGIDCLAIGSSCKGEGIISALELAGLMGCKKCYVFGLDFGVIGGKYYVDGIPPKEGSKSYNSQKIRLRKHKFMHKTEIINVNNINPKLPFKTISIEEYKNEA